MQVNQSNHGADAAYKTIVIGDANVGKTSILSRYFDNTFSKERNSTVGVNFYFKDLQIGKRAVKLQIWDTAGQEHFQSLTRSYWTGANVIIIVYDVTNEESFSNIEKWLKDTKSHLQDFSDIIIAIVGNKSDLYKQRAVDKATAEEYALSRGLLYIETSACTGANIQELFTEIAIQALQNTHPSIRPSNSIVLSDIRGQNETWYGMIKSYCSIL